MKVTLSLLADADVERMLSYGIREFGWEKAQTYYEGLQQSLQMLGEYPRIGMTYGKKTNCRRFVYQRHIIFYRIEKDRIFVGRILDAMMDVDAHLP